MLSVRGDGRGNRDSSTQFLPHRNRGVARGVLQAHHAAMPLDVLQRINWTGQPIRLGSMWMIAKGRRTADCELWTHLLGWELRLTSGATLLQSQVCRTQDDVLDAHEAWKVAMRSKGWH